MRRARTMALAIAAVLLIPVASAQAAGFDVQMKAPTHHPKVGKDWKITVTAKRTGSGKPVHGAAFYEFLYGGAVVSKQYPAPKGGPAKSPWHFTGSFTDTLTFPKRSVGEPLTFRVVVRAGPLGTAHADYPIRVVE
ncbi:MAG TPA: hypothetical protein VHA76_08090 [Solirubrobacterales bacterium]|nr:hypothetical protein [Solirubrobacterales bacterium]